MSDQPPRPVPAASDASRARVLIGIDPGKQTGVAIYDPEAGALLFCRALSFWNAALGLLQGHTLRDVFTGDFDPDASAVACAVIEDARRVGLYHRHRSLQGQRRDAAARSVGEIDAQTRLWTEFFALLGIPVVTVEPTRKKWDAETFQQITGFEGPTNEHARDAARLVWGLTLQQALLMATASAPTARN